MKTVALLLSHELTPEQERELREDWEVDRFAPLPEELLNRWSNVPPDGPYPSEWLNPILQWLQDETRPGDLVLVQGEPGSVYRVVQWCLEKKRLPIYATTMRAAQEERQPDGSVITKRVFKHRNFRTYPVPAGATHKARPVQESAREVQVCLIGEQPIPNLLALRHKKPDGALLVHTEFTKGQTERLSKLLPADMDVQTVPLKDEDVYRIDRIHDAIKEKIDDMDNGRLNLTFNFTGGTKPMVLASHEIAAERGSNLIYVETRGANTLLHRFHFAGNRLMTDDPVRIPALINIQDYLLAHVEKEQLGEGSRRRNDDGLVFEETVERLLGDAVDEIRPRVKIGGAIEIDLVVRLGNRVGIIEAKTDKAKKEGIDQLNTAGGREFLGWYTAKMLVTTRDWTPNSDLRKLAQARGIKIISLVSYENRNGVGYLDPSDI